MVRPYLKGRRAVAASTRERSRIRAGRTMPGLIDLADLCSAGGVAVGTKHTYGSSIIL